MKEKYQKKLNDIHASQELVEHTKQAMRKEAKKEHKKHTITIILKRSAVASAAIVLIGIGGYSYYSSQNQLNVASVSNTSFSMDHNFGKATESKNTTKKPNMTVTKDNQKTIVPDFLAEVKPSKIKGVTVQLGLDDKGIYHATYQSGGYYYYVIGEDVSEAAFIDYLKKKI